MVVGSLRMNGICRGLWPCVRLFANVRMKEIKTCRVQGRSLTELTGSDAFLGIKDPRFIHVELGKVLLKD